MSDSTTADVERAEWERRTLITLAQYHNGIAFRPSELGTEGTRVIRIEQLNKPNGHYDRVAGLFPAANQIANGDLIFSWSATLKVVVWQHGNAVLNQHLFKVIPHGDVELRFLFYLLDFNMDDLSGSSHGSTMKHVKRSELKTFGVDLPPLPEQRKIASILTTVDRLIEQTEALIEKYRRVKQGMMADLLSRGVDEHGKLRPTQKQAPQLYKQSELGWIPKEWECVPLHAVVPKAEYGISVPLNDNAEDIPVLRMMNLQDGRIDKSDLKYSSSREAATLLLRFGDVIFNRTNSLEHVGKTSIWKSELPKASFASYLVRLVPNESRITPLYLTFWMNLPESQIRFRDQATPGVHQVNINPTNLRRTLITLPECTEEQARITSQIIEVEARLMHEQAGLTKLRKLKTGLMQDLLTGKVRVKVDQDEETTADV